MESWADALEELSRLAAATPPIGASALQNSYDLLELAKALFQAPVGIDPGYWPTARFFWPGLEIEVFDEHVEVYRFVADTFDVRYYDKLPGQSFSADFMGELAPLRLAGV